MNEPQQSPQKDRSDKPASQQPGDEASADTPEADVEGHMFPSVEYSRAVARERARDAETYGRKEALARAVRESRQTRKG